MDVLTVGDDVIWRGSWGRDLPKEAKVIGIEVNCNMKKGKRVNDVAWSKVDGRDVIVDLDCEHWAYGSQLNQIK